MRYLKSVIVCSVAILLTAFVSVNNGIPSVLYTPLRIGNIDFTSAGLNIVTDGNAPGGDWIAWFRHANTVANNESLIRHEHFSGTQVPQPIITGIANRGTFASPTVITTDDNLLILDGRGYDGSITNWGQGELGVSDTAAQIAYKAINTWSATGHGSKIEFRTTPSTMTSPLLIASLSTEGSTANPLFAIRQAGQNQFAMMKSTGGAVAPGAGFMQLRVEPGTNAGTCKLSAYAGTSTIGTTIVDNVGSGC